MLHFQKTGNSAYQDANEVYTHVIDPNERRRLALAEIDKSPFSWYHVRTVVVTGVGFFTDAYSIFAIALVTTLMGMVFWQDSNKGTIPSNADIAIKVATSVGTIFGQFVFGYLADLLGRKKMYGIELLIIISATLAQSLCAPSNAISFVAIMVFWRFVLGIGVGGDYPLSSVITSEFASTKRRGAMISAVFAMQGIGQFAGAIVMMIVVVAFKEHLVTAKTLDDCHGDCQASVDKMWRIIIGFGGVPGWFALYYRLTIPETPRYTFDVLLDIEKATADAKRYRSGKIGEAQPNKVQQAKVNAEVKRNYRTPRPTLAEFCRYFGRWRNFLVLFGTAGSWFLLDVAFYGIGLNSGTVLAAVGFGQHDNLYQRLYNTAVGQVVLVSAGAVPGYWVTVFTVDIIGRKVIQIGGFAILTLLFCVIGFHFDKLSENALLACYILAQFFFNFGPNATTFVVPAECFPTRFRATASGISAGAGKAGATLAQLVFAPMAHRGGTNGSSPWLDHVMQIFALFMFCGILTSLLIPETKGKTLEELHGDETGKDVYELRYASRFYRDPTPEERRSEEMRKGFKGFARKYLHINGKESSN